MPFIMNCIPLTVINIPMTLPITRNPTFPMALAIGLADIIIK